MLSELSINEPRQSGRVTCSQQVMQIGRMVFNRACDWELEEQVLIHLLQDDLGWIYFLSKHLPWNLLKDAIEMNNIIRSIVKNKA